MRPIPIASVVSLIFNLASRDTESDSLVWFRCDLYTLHLASDSLNVDTRETHYKILVCFVGRLAFLLPCTHKASSRDNPRLDLRQVDLHHHPLLPRVVIPDLGDSVPRPPNLQENFSLDVALRRSDHQLCVFGISSGTTGKVGLVLFALCVGEVGAFVGVESQAETTFERTEMVA